MSWDERGRPRVRTVLPLLALATLPFNGFLAPGLAGQSGESAAAGGVPEEDVASDTRPADDPHRALLAAAFQEELEAIAGGLEGVMGIQVVDLESGERFGVNEDLVFPQGSAIKVPVLVELFQQASEGTLSVDERVAITGDVMVGGSGHLRHFLDGGSELSLHDLAVLMIVPSDNTATNLLIERLGMERVTARMEELGLSDTRLQRKMIRPEDSAAGRENLSTPAESARLMERIYRCDLPMAEAECRRLQAIMDIPRAGPIQDGVPRGIRVGQKTGTITGVRANWGYVDLEGRLYVVTAMGNYSESGLVTDAIREVSEAAYEHFRRLAGATPYGTRVPLELLREHGPDSHR